MQYAKQDVRENILKAAKEEFLCNGFTDASIRSIVSKSKVSLGNLYRYYKNKEELYNAIVNPVIEDCLNNVNVLIFKEDYFYNIATHMVIFFIDNKDTFNILQKGDFNKYNNFLNELALIISKKVKENIKVANEEMIDIISISFINGLRSIMESYTTESKAINDINLLLKIIFGNLKDKME